MGLLVAVRKSKGLLGVDSLSLPSSSSLMPHSLQSPSLSLGSMLQEALTSPFLFCFALFCFLCRTICSESTSRHKKTEYTVRWACLIQSAGNQKCFWTSDLGIFAHKQWGFFPWFLFFISACLQYIKITLTPGSQWVCLTCGTSFLIPFPPSTNLDLFCKNIYLLASYCLSFLFLCILDLLFKRAHVIFKLVSLLYFTSHYGHWVHPFSYKWLKFILLYGRGGLRGI